MVSAAFITYEHTILLFHRDDKPTIKDPDCWDLIGGHADPGEEPENTLKREIFEEVSIKPESIRFLKEVIDAWGEQTYLYHVELSTDEKKSIKLGNEGKEVKFFAKDAFETLKLTRNLSMYLKKYPDIYGQFRV